MNEGTKERTIKKKRNYLYSPMVHYNNKIRRRERGDHRIVSRMCACARLLSLYSCLVNCGVPPSSSSSSYSKRSQRLHAQKKKKKKHETFANRASSSTRILCYAKQLNWTTTNDSRSSSISSGQRRISWWCLDPNIPRWFGFNWFIWESQWNKWSKCGKTTTLFCTRQWNDDLFRSFLRLCLCVCMFIVSKWLQVFKTNQ